MGEGEYGVLLQRLALLMSLLASTLHTDCNSPRADGGGPLSSGLRYFFVTTGASDTPFIKRQYLKPIESPFYSRIFLIPTLTSKYSFAAKRKRMGVRQVHAGKCRHVTELSGVLFGSLSFKA